MNTYVSGWITLCYDRSNGCLEPPYQRPNSSVYRSCDVRMYGLVWRSAEFSEPGSHDFGIYRIHRPVRIAPTSRETGHGQDKNQDEETEIKFDALKALYR